MQDAQTCPSFRKAPDTFKHFWGHVIWKEPEGKTQRVKTSENFAEEKCLQKIFQRTFSEDRRYHFIFLRVFLDIFEIFAEDCFF